MISVREIFGRGNEQRVFGALAGLATRGHIFYPPEVSAEVERGARDDNDAAYRWIRSTREVAERRATFENVRRVLAIAQDVLDPDSSHEVADPYVVALGLDLQPESLSLDLLRPEERGAEVTVVTEDRKDKPRKLSLATAAGLLGLPTIPMFAFLRAEGLYP